MGGRDATPELPAELELQLVVDMLEDDVTSVELAYRDFERALCGSRDFDSPSHAEARAAMFHHAKTFVCAMRRVGRMCEMLVSVCGRYKAGAKVKVAWRKKKARLDSYIAPRNAIEHARAADSRHGALLLRTNLMNDKLWVSGDSTHAAVVNEAAVRSVKNLRDEVAAVVEEALVEQRDAAQRADEADEAPSGGGARRAGCRDGD